MNQWLGKSLCLRVGRRRIVSARGRAPDVEISVLMYRSRHELTAASFASDDISILKPSTPRLMRRAFSFLRIHLATMRGDRSSRASRRLNIDGSIQRRAPGPLARGPGMLPRIERRGGPHLCATLANPLAPHPVAMMELTSVI